MQIKYILRTAVCRGECFAVIDTGNKICYNRYEKHRKDKTMHYTYKTSGTCSTMIDFDIEDGKLHNIVFTNGCNGNLKAIGRLLEGMSTDFALERLSGIRCGYNSTSCGDQLARAIRKAIAD